MMGYVFEAKVRRLGNSLAVIIPKEELDREGLREGDIVKLSVIGDEEAKRKAAWRRLEGIDKGAAPFERDHDDRADRY